MEKLQGLFRLRIPNHGWYGTGWSQYPQHSVFITRSFAKHSYTRFSACGPIFVGIFANFLTMSTEFFKFRQPATSCFHSRTIFIHCKGLWSRGMLCKHLECRRGLLSYSSKSFKTQQQSVWVLLQPRKNFVGGLSKARKRCPCSYGGFLINIKRQFQGVNGKARLVLYDLIIPWVTALKWNLSKIWQAKIPHSL